METGITPIERRAAEWDATVLFCRNHPNRPAKRSRYVRRGERLCSMCARTSALSRAINAQRESIEKVNASKGFVSTQESFVSAER